MKHQILQAVGILFTQNWVKSQGNPNLIGFTRSAEQCLEERRIYKIGLLISKLFITCGLSLMIIDSLLSGLGVVVIGSAIILLVNKIFKKGNTSKQIAAEWKPIRKKLLKKGVISRIEKNLKKDHPKRDFVSQDEIRGLLVRSFDELVSSLSSNLIEAQREGMLGLAITIQNRMNELENLARQDLKLHMEFGQYFH